MTRIPPRGILVFMIQPRIKKRARHRAKILEGQIKGLLRGIEQEKYCADLLVQSLAIQKSLKSLDHLLLQNHLQTCARKQIKSGKQEKKTIRELLEIYRLSNL